MVLEELIISKHFIPKLSNLVAVNISTVHLKPQKNAGVAHLLGMDMTMFFSNITWEIFCKMKKICKHKFTEHEDKWCRGHRW